MLDAFPGNKMASSTWAMICYKEQVNSPGNREKNMVLIYGLFVQHLI